MKNLINKLSAILKPKPNTSQTATYFKKVEGQYTNHPNIEHPQVLDRITQLNRIIVQGKDKDLLMAKIRQTIMDTQLGHPVSPQLQDACEIIHYAILNNTPVLINHLLKVWPEMNIKAYEVIDEKQHEQQHNEENEQHPELKGDIIIESYAQKDQAEYYDQQRHKWEKNRKKR